MTRTPRRRLRLVALPVFASLFLPGLVRNAVSQVAWMTPSYTSYASATSDGTYIYTSVTVSGTTTGTCPSFPASLANECHTTTHAPQVYNTIGNVGGWQYGGPVYWSSSISMTNNQKIAATAGTEYTFSYTAGAEVVFRFTSAGYALKEGQMLVFSSNIKGGILKMHTGEELRLTPKDQHVEATLVANGESSRTRISGPGKYLIWLENLRLSRTADSGEVRVPGFTLRDYEITDAALKSGIVEIELPGLIRVRALDREGRPVTGQEVAFTSRQARSTFQTQTDSQGEVYVLGSPEDYSVLTVPPHDESVTLETSTE